MNTVYGRILMWSLGVVLVGLLAVTGISLFHSLRRSIPPNAQDALSLDQAINAYRSGGPGLLRAELVRMDRYLSGHRYLVDARGTDLVTGAQRATVSQESGRRIIVCRSSDGMYRLLLSYPTQFDFVGALPYHGLLLVTVAILCGALAANLAAPLRNLARAVDRFGAGDLSIRVNSTRKDEIGDVSRAFDRMADRLSTLLTAERRLLQDISHELRSPLARLSFASELARTAPDRDAAIARLNREIARLTDLVGGLIQVTRAEGDPSAHNSQALRLDQLIAEVAADCRLEAEQRHSSIDIAAEALPRVTLHGDREVLRRAIENVLRNAVRYTPAGAAVVIELSRSPSQDAVRISIRDYGPGVPGESLKRIFQPFFRLDDSRDSATGGVGLGLAIAHRAVTLHHGKLWAENGHPGLRVWIELPVHLDS